MKSTRFVILTLLACLCLAPVAASADDLTPVPQPTSAPVVEPTPPVVVDTPISEPIAPVTDNTPVAVSREKSTPITQINGTGSNTQPATQSTEVLSRPNVPDVSGTGSPPPPTVPSYRGQPVPGAGNVTTAPGITPPPVDVSTNPDAGVATYVYEPHSAARPGQLKCTGKAHPTSAPFLVAPYSGWTDVVSFVDPDSRVDTIVYKIVLANGLSAQASQGQASDLFPSYWSPSLRQYVNYDGHNGYDFDLSYQPVLAAAAGTVEFAGWNGASEFVGYGQMILIRHTNGYVTLYGHLSRLDVQAGDKVTAGQQIGISGSTGHSSGPHLHFSVFHDCHVTDPYGWTGHGRDPLFDFGGEHAAYLWAPGHEPLLLNPPPGWPSYPLGLHISLPAGVPRARRGQVPVVDRLLLLSLPSPRAGTPVPAGVALARTEASITQEAEALVPQLDDLRAQGVVDSYQVIPAAAAVWVRGTATADQLEGLTGVASLAGVQPHDLSAAQTGLGHSVLIQTGRQQASSLWPVGYRSALHGSRPITSILIGHALIAGFALPGQQVTVSLRRGNAIPGAAEAVGDPETGGFVAMIHDPGGRPVTLVAGDTVQIASGWRVSQVGVAPLSVRARARFIEGRTAVATTAAVTITGLASDPTWKRVVISRSDGRLRIATKQTLTVGTLAVTTVVDGAGNQESASAYVPGAVVTEGGSTVHGWAASQRPRLKVWRHGHLLVSRDIHPAADGTFQVSLGKEASPVVLAGGDIVQIGSRLHHRRLTLPALSASLAAGARSITLKGPAGRFINVRFTRNDGHGWSRVTSLGPSGVQTLRLPGAAPVGLGDSAALEYDFPAGDRVAAGSQARGVLVDLGTARVSGRLRPSAVVSIHVLTASGAEAGGAVAATSRDSGNFSAVIRESSGRPLSITTGMRVAFHDRGSMTSIIVPWLGLSVQQHTGQIEARAPRSREAVLHLTFAHGGPRTQRFTRSRLRQFRMSVSPIDLSRLRSVSLLVSVGQGVSFERGIQLTGAANSHSNECVKGPSGRRAAKPKGGRACHIRKVAGH